MTAMSPTLPALHPVVANDGLSAETPLLPDVRPHQGMPPLDMDGPALSYFEFWPMWAF